MLGMGIITWNDNSLAQSFVSTNLWDDVNDSWPPFTSIARKKRTIKSSWKLQAPLSSTKTKKIKENGRRGQTTTKRRPSPPTLRRQLIVSRIIIHTNHNKQTIKRRTVTMLRSGLSKAALRAARPSATTTRFMSGKIIKFGVDGRNAMLKGVETLADAVQVSKSRSIS